jgi:SAM-dependent methyltransferase
MNKELVDIVYLGNVPLAGHFPKQSELSNVNRYDLSLMFCNECKLVQTDSIIDSDVLFKDYRYMSSIGLSEHFKSVADMYKDKFNLNNQHKILEIGSNDGVLLEPLIKLGLNVVGIEPAVNISNIAVSKGCNVVNDYFNEVTALKYFQEKFDLIISNNCFAHIDNIRSVVRGVKNILKNDKYFVIEIHYLKNLIDELQYDFIYHEHLYYYSLNSLNNLFKQFEMTIVDFEEINIHSGSIRVYVKNSFEEVPDKVQYRLDMEIKHGLTDANYFKNFGAKIKSHIISIKNEIKYLKDKNFKIAGYGASGRGNMLLNMCNITYNDIDYIVDESPERVNRYIPGVNIPIVSKEQLLENTPDYIFIIAWNYFDTINKKIENIGLYNMKYILPFKLNNL